MSGIRWLPLNLPPGSSSYKLIGVLNDTVTGQGDRTVNITMTLASTSEGAASNRPPKLGPANDCPEWTAFNADSVEALTFPFGRFQEKSPLRPLCLNGTQLEASKQTAVGDFLVTSDKSTRASFSGWAHLKGRELPKGFTPLFFTPSGSNLGYVENILYIETIEQANLLITTPQVRLKEASLIRNRGDLVILKLSKSKKQASTIAVNTFDSNPLAPLRMTFVAPSTGYYLFGLVDHGLNKFLPAAFGDPVNYQNEWKSKTFDYGDLKVIMSGDSDVKFTVDLAEVPSSLKETIYAAYNFGTVSSLEALNIQFSQQASSDAIWAKYQKAANTASGGQWVKLSSSLGTITVNEPGIYGLVSKGTVSGALPSHPPFLFIFSVFLSICFL